MVTSGFFLFSLSRAYFMKKIFRHAGKDLPASLVVFLVAVPLCLGVALGSNAPILSGVIAGIVGGMIVGSLSGSQLSVSGPAAGLITTVVVILDNLKDPTTGVPIFEAFTLAVVIAGVIQILLGLLKAGKIADFVPVSVLKGMLAAIGLLLIFKQFPHLVGYDKDFEGDEAFFQKDGHNTFSEIELAFMNITPLAVIIGFVGLAVQWFWDSSLFPAKKYKYIIPAPLIVVLLAVLLDYILDRAGGGIRDEHMVALPLNKGIEDFGSLILNTPNIQHLKNVEVWKGAIEIAIIASLESLLSVQAIDKLDPLRRNTPVNRELMAQGVGNTVSGMLGGLPITSVIVRSSANLNAGAQSKLSTIMHGAILLLSLLFFPNLLNKIPLCALASILIYTGYKLASPVLFKEQWNKGTTVFLPFLITILSILLTDLLIGIAIGLLVGVFFVIRSNYKVAIRMANEKDQYLIKFSNQVSFLNKALLKSTFDKIPPKSIVSIDLSQCHFIDNDILDMLRDYETKAAHEKIRLDYRYLNDHQKEKMKI